MNQDYGFQITAFSGKTRRSKERGVFGGNMSLAEIWGICNLTPAQRTSLFWKGQVDFIGRDGETLMRAYLYK